MSKRDQEWSGRRRGAGGGVLEDEGEGTRMEKSWSGGDG